MPEVKLFCRLIGRRGNFSPTGLTREQFIERIHEARQLVGLPHTTLFAPKPDFTNRVVKVGEDSDFFFRKSMEPKYGPPDFSLIPDGCYPKNKQICPVIGEEEVERMVMVRTHKPADGAVEFGNEHAIAFFTGDCPVVVLRDTITETPFPGDKPFAVLRAGFRTLIRANHDEPNIIENAVKYFNLKNTEAFVGYGIGPCCWKLEEDKPEVQDPSLSRHPELLASCIRKTTRSSPSGPGHLSVDLYKLAKGLLMEVGITEDKIFVNNRCTCCYDPKGNGQPYYWSHARFKAGKQEVDGRNMAIAFLTTKVEGNVEVL